MNKTLLIFKNTLIIPIIIILLILFTPCCYIISFFVPKKFIKQLIYYISSIIRYIIFKTINIKVVFKGLENIPKNRNFIIASNHQSVIEASLILNKYLPNTTYCLKKEITYIPFWKRLVKQFEGILVNRQKSSKDFKELLKNVKNALKKGQNVVIFPEGTRAPLGHPAKFKKGIVAIYLQNNVPVVPIALKTGHIFPKNSKIFYPGTIIIEFLEPIEPNLESQKFLTQLETTIHTRALELSQQ